MDIGRVVYHFLGLYKTYILQLYFYCYLHPFQNFISCFTHTCSNFLLLRDWVSFLAVKNKNLFWKTIDLDKTSFYDTPQVRVLPRFGFAPTPNILEISKRGCFRKHKDTLLWCTVPQIKGLIEQNPGCIYLTCFLWCPKNYFFFFGYKVSCQKGVDIENLIFTED